MAVDRFNLVMCCALCMVTTCGFPENRKFKLKEDSKGEIFVGINQLRSELKILHCRRVCKCRRKYSVDELTSRPVDCRQFDCRRDDGRRFDMLPTQTECHCSTTCDTPTAKASLHLTTLIIYRSFLQ